MTEIAGEPSRSLRADLSFIGMAVISGAVLLYLGRSLTFLQDEWPSITFDGGPLDYLRPVNQHWNTFPLLLYRATFQVVGLHSYLPYLAEVIVLHLLAVGGAYALMRRRVGPALAAVCALPLLLLGSGGENLFWAFQTGFVGSVMFGVWAIFFIERPGRWAPYVASALMVASFTSSGMGLFFPVIAAVRTLMDPRLRLRVLAVVPPLAAYVLWFAALGSDDVGGRRVFVEPALLRFVVRGIVNATERTSGLTNLPDGHLLGLVAFVALTAFVAYRVVRGPRTPALAAGCMAGVMAMYVAIAFVRLHADPGYDHATSSRYVYVAAFMLVLAVVDLLPDRREAWSRHGRLGIVLAVALVLALALSTASNVDALRAKRAEYQHAATATRAFVDVALTRGHEPWVDRQVVRGWMPSVAVLERTIQQHGSPLHDELFPGVVIPPDAAAREIALLGLIGDDFRIEEATSIGGFVAVDIDTTGSAGVSNAERCARARLEPGSALWIHGIPARARVRVTSSAAIDGRVFLAHDRAPSRPLFPPFQARIAKDVVVPDIGDGRSWNLGVDSPLSTASFDMCVLLAADTDASAHGLRAAVQRSDRFVS